MRRKLCKRRKWSTLGAVGLLLVLITLLGSAKESAAASSMLPLLPSEGVKTSLVADLLPDQPAVPATADGLISDVLDLLPADLPEEAAVRTDLSVKKGINVLIYHTHTTEAYRQTDDCTYVESGQSRTAEADRNIQRVGEELKTQLEALGFGVIHDTTDHEPPKLATAYSRSEVTMLANKEKYPDIDLFIDLHRDAANVQTQQDDVVTVDGQRCARIMCVVGKGEKYDQKPNWQANYSLAQAVCAELEGARKGFTRPIRLKPGRYNQHISDMCLLIEVGHNANTLGEALCSMPHLAKAIADVVSIQP
ncbi:MAG: stage II sporulation protein P [Christensenellaceae bacterium]|nr:stage II sporulation protein P [Christensenellaceae bacterium]